MTDYRNRIVELRTMKASGLAENPLNWRRHPAKQRGAMETVLSEIGWVDTALYNQRTNRLIDGHLRRDVAGDAEIPVLVVDLSEDEERKVLATLDPIAALADYDAEAFQALTVDMDLDLGGFFSDEDFAGLFPVEASEPPGDAGAQMDRAAELQEQWQVQPGDVWEIPSQSVPGKVHRLVCGDCTDAEVVAGLMGDERAEMLFTSPPYADQREYGGNDLSVETLVKFIPIFKAFVDYQCINLGIKRHEGEIVQYWDAYIEVAKDCGLKLLSWNVWDQGQVGSVGKLTAMFPIEHEFIFVFGEMAGKLRPTVPNKDAGTISSHTADRQRNGKVVKKKPIEIRPLREMGTVCRINVQLARNLNTVHSAMFPVGLPEAYITSLSGSGSLILDPFLGSGTTMVAAERTARLCYGIEIEPKYCAVILQRLTDLGLHPRRVESVKSAPEK